MGIVDGAVQIVLERCWAGIEAQFDIDFKKLAEGLLFGVDAVAAVELHVLETNDVLAH